MSRRTQTRALLAALAGVVLSSGACDRVGAPLVDHHKPLESVGIGPIPCRWPPACSAPPPEVPNPQRIPPLPVAVGVICADELRAGCNLASETGLDGEGRAIVGCSAAGPAHHITGLDGLAVGCSEIELTAAEDGADTVRVAGIDWRHVNLSLATERPFVLELDRPRLDNVAIILRGPVTLRVIDGRLNAMRAAGAASDADSDAGAVAPAAAWRVEFERVEGNEVSIGRDESSPSALAITHSELSNVQLLAERLDLESVRMVDGLVAARSLVANDTLFHTVAFEAEEALLSACNMDTVRVRACGAWTAIATEILNSEIAACTEPPLRIYSSKVLTSIVDGVIASDLTSFASMRFGVRAPTELEAWGGFIASVNFCGDTERVRLAGSARVTCSDCDEGLAADALCLDQAFGGTEPPMGWCEAFETTGECSDVRDRERPITQN